MLKKIIKNIIESESYSDSWQHFNKLKEHYNISVEAKEWNEPEFPGIQDGGDRYAFKLCGQINTEWSKNYDYRSEMITDIIFILLNQKVLLRYVSKQ